ncbi:hypothetical protein RHSIM_RhsimUnG0117400 [Rhododendron simsii]|uniref:U3 small nucleolar RNA-associated protein 11 n=1 Tax=Rhododendron simsii TaxID=118357 RepID=A0A834L2J1_RHOSS|nr:hypothetical protein RHSIM_RhsimUnG0117400 [Rhododendron simsii]
MSSLRNAVYRPAHQERAQPYVTSFYSAIALLLVSFGNNPSRVLALFLCHRRSRRKFGLLEKHKDYLVRAKAYHKKQDALQKLKEKAAFRNPDEFYFKMINTKTVNGVHKPGSQANKYTEEELMVMKTQDIGYVLQKLQSEKKKIEKLTAVLQSTDSQLPSKHVYYAEYRVTSLKMAPLLVPCANPPDRGDGQAAGEDAKEIQLHNSKVEKLPVMANLRENIKSSSRKGRWSWYYKGSGLESCFLVEAYLLCSCRETAASYRELAARKGRVNDLEKLYMDMAMQKELKKKGRKRKLHEDEIVCPTSRPVYKWRSERKR